VVGHQASTAWTKSYEKIMTESLTIERDYAVSPQRLFQGWTDVRLLRQWFGCAPDVLWSVHVWDVHVGGELHVSLDFPDGRFEVRGLFLIVDAPRHLRFRWSGEEIVDVRIEPHGTGSRLYLEHTWVSHEDGRNIRTAGWTSSLGQLAFATHDNKETSPHGSRT
jgi:uncharacterized protein YndB with AHSA1/START domain